MSSIKHIPVIVHRWFKNGEGWAYHPEMAKHLVSIIKQVTPQMQSAARVLGSESEVPISHCLNEDQFADDAEMLLGFIMPDTNCLFKASEARNPFLLKLAKTSMVFTKEEDAFILDRLRDVNPKKDGLDDSLYIELA